METKVTINVKLIIPITHLPEAAPSFVEQLARDEITDILHNANEDIDIWHKSSPS